MKTGDMGERDFLASIRDMVNELDGAVLGFDEDASDIPVSPGLSIVINVDTFVGSTDWLPGMTAAQVGRKTAVMALSDIIAKSARPHATMLSLCVPRDYEVTSAQEIIRGFSQYCLKSGITFIGGDLGMTSDVVLTGVAIGKVSPDRIVTRGGAKEGDILAVTGEFGLTSVAYKTLLEGYDVTEEFRNIAILAAYKPRIYFGFVEKLAEMNAISSCMDSSDGLGITLHTMASHSRMGFLIDRLPSSENVKDFARDNALNILELVMCGGEEFILVLTIPNEKWDLALEIAADMKVPLTRIGDVVTGDRLVYETSEGQTDIPSVGYDNFREWDKAA